MDAAKTVSHPAPELNSGSSPGDPCILVLFGASGDLTKRLLMPALYNLLLDGLLPEQFAIVGIAMDELTTDDFRSRMTRDIRQFNTRKDFDEKAWQKLCSRLHYTPGKFDDEAAYARLYQLVTKLDGQCQARGNILFYLATPPSLFGPISGLIDRAGFRKLPGWKRIIVEKPFGTDLPSARELNRQILAYWDEKQIYRVDHYLGKETVQNILAFRFANGMFEPLWNRYHVDQIQMNVSEAVTVEGRGGYYDRSGVLRDMMQNHMFQMLAYVCMEPPTSFAADDVRNEKAKLLQAVRVYSPQEALANSVRGQYGAGRKADGSECPAYRNEPGVNPKSNTETFAAVRLFIDNWRWEGVPVYLRSGKALWKRGTEMVVQFKKAPEKVFRGTPVPKLGANRLIFHIQPDQGIELLFQAKIPGPVMRLQPVNMRFSYGEAFRAARGTGYEVMLYSCMIGDATLFSRTDLVEAAWGIAQPILDAWAANPPEDFPNYPAGTWGPRAGYELPRRDGRRWFEVVNREALERVPLFKGGDPLFLSQVAMSLRPRAAAPGETIIRKGDPGAEMYVICRGEAEVVDGAGRVIATLREGDCFGEVALLLSEPRTATVRAKTSCDLFVLEKGDFSRILRDQPQFAHTIQEIARERYNRPVATEHLLAAE
ncbi:MAG: glucose-6-phosphate dehydrogenase [Gemmataceae bacterium]|nr:glucose-6-phosphate dehydrogenase [Gemmataceae bacterium]